MQHFAIILAGGKGTRMGNPTPKQFLLLNKIPVLMRTLHAFFRSQTKPEMVVVLEESLHDTWLDLCHQHEFHVPHVLAHGGSTRFQSVYNGLKCVFESRIGDTGDPFVPAEKCLIAVHDGARPLVQPQLIDQIYQVASVDGACIPGIVSTDSLRWLEEQPSDQRPVSRLHKALDRARVYRIQTPQVFRGDILWDAYQQDELPEFTDDASVVEKKGIPIRLIDGDPLNFKITLSQDLAVAETLLRLPRV